MYLVDIAGLIRLLACVQHSAYDIKAKLGVVGPKVDSSMIA